MLGRSGATACGTDRANPGSARRLCSTGYGRFLPGVLAALTLTLSGCFSAFEETRGRHSSTTASVRRAAAGEYQVVGGDTLYSIAFRNQLDFHELASWNRIGGPDYRIYPGRVLRLTPPATSTERKPPETLAAIQPAPAKPAANANPSGAPRTPAIAPPSRPAVALPPDSAPPPRVPPPATAPAATGPRFDAGRWQWPTQGRVARSFGADGNKGIDIAGRLGQIVIAVGPGKVVYSGTALKGYGELVIIKHDEQYLSAYGFNQRRLVNEGDIVGAGQPIAELGYGPEQKPELHFEIRDRGRPVDPLPLLPKS